MGTKECIECGSVYTNYIKYFPKQKMYYNKKSNDPFNPIKVKYVSVSRICVFCINKKKAISNKKYALKKKLRKLDRIIDGLDPDVTHENLKGSIWFCVTQMKYYESEDEMYHKDYSSITQEEIDSINFNI